MEVEGQIYQVMEPQSGISQRTGNVWMSQEFVISYFWFPNQQTPSRMTCRLFGEDKVKAAQLRLNDEVKLKFYIDSNQTPNGRWFNEVRITSVEKKVNGTFVSIQGLQSQTAQSSTMPASTLPPAPSAPAPQQMAPQTKTDDLPF